MLIVFIWSNNRCIDGGWEGIREDMCCDDGVTGDEGLVEWSIDRVEGVICGPCMIVGSGGLVGLIKGVELSGLEIRV